MRICIISENKNDSKYYDLISDILQNMFNPIIYYSENLCNCDNIAQNFDLICVFNNKIFDNKDKCLIRIVYNSFTHFEELACLNHVILYLNDVKLNGDDKSKLSPFIKKLDIDLDIIYYKNDILLEFNRIAFLWFNFKYVYMNANINLNKSCEYLQIIDKNTNMLNDTKRGQILNNYIANYGMDDVLYMKRFDDACYNYDWIKLCNQPFFDFNRHFTTKNKVILFQLEKYQDKDTLLKYPICKTKFIHKKKKLVGMFNMSGAVQRNNNTYWANSSIEENILSKIQDVSFDLTFLLYSNFDRFNFVYKYINNDLFDIGFIKNDKAHNFNKFFNYLIKQKKSINEMSEYMFHIYIGGNDLGTSLVWQLLNYNVVFIPYPFEFESIFMYGLEPYEHFIPISNKLFDIEEKLNYMLQNIEMCEKIANKAHNYISIFLNNNCEFLDLISKETIYLYNIINKK